MQEAADVEVLARLRHDRLVGCHVQHHQVHAAHTGQHVAHESLVAGDVYEREHDVAFGGVREPEIDRDAARLFLLQAIGIGPGERVHQRALAVVDVSGSAYDDVLHVADRFYRFISLVRA